MKQETIFIGEERSGLILTRKIRRNARSIAFECLCSHCGNITKIPNCKFGAIQSCGCLKHRKGEDNPAYKGVGQLSGAKWWSYVKNAKDRHINFTLTIKEAWDIFEKQKGKCALTGEQIHFWKSSRNKDKITSKDRASLDRIDNRKGYTKNNVHWVNDKINQIKMDLPLDRFIDLCKKVAKHDKNYRRHKT